MISNEIEGSAKTNASMVQKAGINHPKWFYRIGLTLLLGLAGLQVLTALASVTGPNGDKAPNAIEINDREYVLSNYKTCLNLQTIGSPDTHACFRNLENIVKLYNDRYGLDKSKYAVL